MHTQRNSLLSHKAMWTALKLADTVDGTVVGTAGVRSVNVAIHTIHHFAYVTPRIRTPQLPSIRVLLSVPCVFFAQPSIAFISIREKTCSPRASVWAIVYFILVGDHGRHVQKGLWRVGIGLDQRILRQHACIKLCAKAKNKMLCA